MTKQEVGINAAVLRLEGLLKDLPVLAKLLFDARTPFEFVLAVGLSSKIRFDLRAQASVIHGLLQGNRSRGQLLENKGFRESVGPISAPKCNVGLANPLKTKAFTP